MAGGALDFEPMGTQEGDPSLDESTIGIGKADFRDRDTAGDSQVFARVFEELIDLFRRERVPGKAFSVVTHGANSIVG